MKGETLSESELSRLKPIRGEGGRTWRAFCPFHGSDKQRSLRVDRESGRFQCFACEAWGYMDWAREQFAADRLAEKAKTPRPNRLDRRPAEPPPKGVNASKATPSNLTRGGAASDRSQKNATKGPDSLSRFSPHPPSRNRESLSAPGGKSRARLQTPSTPYEEQARRPLLDPPAAQSRPLPQNILPERPLTEWLAEYQAALPGSLGEEYLQERGIPLALAQQYGLGYASPGRWAHRSESGKTIRDWHYGRLVFPHTGPGGALVNLYGRALGERVPKALRHDHLPGAKGYFNFPALDSEEIYVCEGPFDALSLLAAYPGLAVLAIFGVQGWRHDWCSTPKKITFALDADAAGQKAWRSLARQLVLRGKKVHSLPQEAYGGAKDLNEAWVQGTLSLVD